MKKYMQLILIMLALALVTPVLAGPPATTMPVQLFDADGDAAKVTSRGAQLGVTADYAHHELHEGNSYSSTFNATLASGAATTFLMNTPSGTVRGHLVISLRSSGESNVKVYEGSTVSALGTAMQETNHRRDSGNIASIVVTRAPTVTGLGSNLEGFEFHVGASQTRGGEARGISELVMKPSTLYIINGVSEASNNDVTLSLDWYEDSGDAP